jgi:hypothetical protein
MCRLKSFLRIGTYYWRVGATRGAVTVKSFGAHLFRAKLYDKRDVFNFPIVNFPFICSNIPAAPAYGVYIFQLIRYSRAGCSYQDFLDRGMLLAMTLLNPGFLLAKLKSSLRKFYGHYHELVDFYEISVSQITTDMFHLSFTFPGPFLIHDLSSGL